MKTIHVKEHDLLLYSLDELAPEKHEAIRSHLTTCTECRKALEELRQWHSAVSRIGLPRPEEAALKRSRNLVALAIEEKQPAPETGRLISANRTIFRKLVQPAAALALLVLGIFIGKGIDSRGTLDKSLHSIENAVPVSQFHVFPRAEQEGRIEIHFQSMQQNIISGEVDDPEILVALSYMLVNEPRDNIRLKAVDLLKRYSTNSGVQNALLHALGNDPNTGIRFKAVQILTELPLTGRIKESIISALFNDTNQRVRMEAALALSRDPNPENLAILKRHARDDDYTRAMLLKHDTGPLAVERE
jgi:hypothetical protein